MNQVGYSGTPLARKLGFKAGFRVRLVHQPDHYFDLFTDWPEKVSLLKDKNTTKDLVHYFTTSAVALAKDIAALRQEIYPDGTLWVSWPKKASKVPTDITEDIIRELALANGLVDVKVCAVDNTWSGLKLVVPVKDREK